MEGLIMAVTILGFFLILFGFVALMRYLSYRETLALAERGLVRAERAGGNGADTLRWGIVITAVGLALCLGLYPLGFLGGTRFPLGLGPWMLVGLLPTFFGLGLVLIYVLTRERKDERPAPPAEVPPAPPATGGDDPALK